MERCGVCGERLDGCVCCEGCGHVCPLDLGEPFCPVCNPEPVTLDLITALQQAEKPKKNSAVTTGFDQIHVNDDIPVII